MTVARIPSGGPVEQRVAPDERGMDTMPTLVVKTLHGNVTECRGAVSTSSPQLHEHRPGLRALP